MHKVVPTAYLTYGKYVFCTTVVLLYIVYVVVAAAAAAVLAARNLPVFVII